VLATLVIGLREGLEAALIVGIIAAFLRNNGKSLVPMWLGVALAVLLSIAVGVSLDLVEQVLPQAAQEGMEAVIGAIAIGFVTSMIAWMNAHARDMKRQIEAEAAAALSQAGTFALASMAFLAVLKEGFETSVFLLATFSAAQSPTLAAAGAIIGLLLSVVIGWGIYVGGVRLNLSRFFRFTSAFLILVAAGLVITSLRSAHEAGWLDAGQQQMLNLSWLVAPGSIQSALITGVLGIPADPRLIEVIGWCAYLVPVTLLLYWPRPQQPQPMKTARLQFAAAAALAVLALGLVVFYPTARPQVPARATLVATTGDTTGDMPRTIGSAQLSAPPAGAAAVLRVVLDGAANTTLPLTDNHCRPAQHDGVETTACTITRSSAPADAPSSLTLDQIVTLSGGRIPVGLNPAEHPGPFAAGWSVEQSTNVWIADGILLDAAERSTTTVTFSGSGLQTPRTLRVSDKAAAATGWQVSAAYRNQAVAALNAVAAARTERTFWAMQLPVILAIAAFLLAIASVRSIIRQHRGPDEETANSIAERARRTDGATAKGATYAAH
jgi:high-affinity iron transporter